MPKLTLNDQLKQLFTLINYQPVDIDGKINEVFQIAWHRFAIKAEKDLEVSEIKQLEQLVSGITEENKNLFLSKLAENKRNAY